jgi:hypothetical protein
MKPISILSRVEDGQLKRNSKLVRSAIEHFEGKEIEIKISRKYPTRSIPQNKFYWGSIIPQFQELINDNWREIKSSEETHEILKFSCNYDEKVNEETGEIIRIPKSTTELTTTGFMDYHQKLRQLAMDYFNTVLHEPNEQLEIFKK